MPIDTAFDTKTDADAWSEYERSLDRLLLIGATAGEKERAAFAAGWKAREQAPNTLILDTTNAQMIPVPNASATASSWPAVDQRIVDTPSVEVA